MAPFEAGKRAGAQAVRQWHWEGEFSSPEACAERLTKDMLEELANVASLYEKNQEVARRHEEYFKGYLRGIEEGLTFIRETNERATEILARLSDPTSGTGEQDNK